MLSIELYEVIEFYDTEPRQQKKCSDCDKIRLCTKLTLKPSGVERHHIEWLCNECLTKTPNWVS